MKTIFRWLIIVGSAFFVALVFFSGQLFSPEYDILTKIIVLLIWVLILTGVFFLLSKLLTPIVIFFRSHSRGAGASRLTINTEGNMQNIDNKMGDQMYGNPQFNISSDSVTKKGVVIGIFYSFLIFLLGMGLSFVLAKIVIPGLYLGGRFNELWSYQFFPIIVSLIISSPFLLLNTIVFFASKNRGHKKGLLFGYLFFLIIFIIAFIPISKTNSQAVPLSQHINAYDFATHQNDTAGCLSAKEVSLYDGAVPEESSRNICLFNLALKKNDTSICDNLPDNANSIFTKEHCYMEIAETSENGVGCNTVKRKDMCFYESAMRKADASICNKIDQNSADPDIIKLRKSCYDYLGQSE